MRRILFIALLAAITACGFAQTPGSLSVDQDSRIDRLMKKQRDVYAVSKTMSGYRVQIFMEIGNDAVSHAEVEKKRFTEAFPEIPVYLSYEQPYYRLRVGDFRNRVEAEKCLRLVKPQFNLAFVTADIINPPTRIETLELEEPTEDGGEESGENWDEND